MNTVINKNQIVELYVQDFCPYCETYERMFRLEHKKGDEIDYIFPRLWRKKYYTCDLYYQYFSGFGLWTKQEMLNWLLENIDFKDSHLIEKDGDVYRLPRVVIKLTNNTTHYKYFDTKELCEQYLTNLMSNSDFLVEL